jgi:CheY-like chemotaxis protein
VHEALAENYQCFSEWRAGQPTEGEDMKDDSILLVENNPDHALLMIRALRKAGVGTEVLVARDGVEALDHLHGPGNNLPDLVLLEVRLPKVDGLEVLKRLRGNDRTRCLPVVLLTSCEREQEALAGGSAADLCLPKHVDFDRFQQDVRQVGSLLSDTRPDPIPERGATTWSGDARLPRADFVRRSPRRESAVV